MKMENNKLTLEGAATPSKSLNDYANNPSKSTMITVDKHGNTDQASGLFSPISCIEYLLFRCYRKRYVAAKLQKDGSYDYNWIKKAVTEDCITKHLNGDTALCVFLTKDKGDNTELAVIDIDNKEKYEDRLSEDELQSKVSEIKETLEEHGLYCLAVKSKSGTGYHLWVHWGFPQPSLKVKQFIKSILSEIGIKEGAGPGIAAGCVEIFTDSSRAIALPFFGEMHNDC